jgi:thiol-disulfide isomerase/thioredoxin
MTTLKAHTLLIFLLGLVLGAALVYALLPSPHSVATNPRSLIWPEIPDWLATPEVFGKTVDVNKTKWTLRGLDSADVEFSDLSGRVVFLNLWSTWCGTCVAEMPSIQALYDSLKDGPVTFLIVSDESLDTLQRFAKRQGLTLPIVQSVSTMPKQFEFQGVPLTVVLDKTGKVVLAEEGGRRWDDRKVIKFIRKLF